MMTQMRTCGGSLRKILQPLEEAQEGDDAGCEDSPVQTHSRSIEEFLRVPVYVKKMSKKVETPGHIDHSFHS